MFEFLAKNGVFNASSVVSLSQTITYDDKYSIISSKLLLGCFTRLVADSANSDVWDYIDSTVLTDY